MHRGVKRVYEQRRGMVDSGEGVDWGMAEALAFGTLISEGVPSGPCPVPTCSCGCLRGD